MGRIIKELNKLVKDRGITFKSIEIDKEKSLISFKGFIFNEKKGISYKMNLDNYPHTITVNVNGLTDSINVIFDIDDIGLVCDLYFGDTLKSTVGSHD